MIIFRNVHYEQKYHFISVFFSGSVWRAIKSHQDKWKSASVKLDSSHDNSLPWPYYSITEVLKLQTTQFFSHPNNRTTSTQTLTLIGIQYKSIQTLIKSIFQQKVVYLEASLKTCILVLQRRRCFFYQRELFCRKVTNLCVLYWGSEH